MAAGFLVPPCLFQLAICPGDGVCGPLTPLTPRSVCVAADLFGDVGQ